MSQQAVTVKVTTVVVPAATDTVLIPANQIRKSLTIYNAGANTGYLGFNIPAVVGVGIPIPTGNPGNQRTFGPANGVPTDAIHAISTAGTTFVIEEGN